MKFRGLRNACAVQERVGEGNSNLGRHPHSGEWGSGSGLLESFRGASGGYRVTRRAADISVAEVIAAIEGPIAMTECSAEEGLCSQEDSCELRGNWQRISLAVAQALQGVSLAEMGAPAPPARNPLRILTLNAG